MNQHAPSTIKHYKKIFYCPTWKWPHINLSQSSCGADGKDNSLMTVCFFFFSLHRMIPSTSKNFLINDLAPGREYDLCVLAVYDDGITSLTATRVVGCVQFHTASDVNECRFMPSQFLGGTMIIIIGGIIVASVLVFIIILMIRYKTYTGPEDSKSKISSSMHSQTNGSQQRLQHSSTAKQLDSSESLHEGAQAPKECMALVLCMDDDKKEEPASTTAVLEVELPQLNLDRLKRRTSLDAQRSGPPSEDTQTDSSLTGSTMSLCLIGPNAGTKEAPRLKDNKSALANVGLLPNELARTRHRFSFDGGDYSIFQSHSYPRRAKTRWNRSTNQLDIESLASSPLANRRVTFSSTEWMLESTVWGLVWGLVWSHSTRCKNFYMPYDAHFKLLAKHMYGHRQTLWVAREESHHPASPSHSQRGSLAMFFLYAAVP